MHYVMCPSCDVHSIIASQAASDAARVLERLSLVELHWKLPTRVAEAAGGTPPGAEKGHAVGKQGGGRGRGQVPETSDVYELGVELRRARGSRVHAAAAPRVYAPRFPKVRCY